MRDRLDAVGGTVEVASLPGTGTTVTAMISRPDDAAAACVITSLPCPVV
jgi:signal transduction histidine kinase